MEFQNEEGKNKFALRQYANPIVIVVVVVVVLAVLVLVVVEVYFLITLRGARLQVSVGEMNLLVGVHTAILLLLGR